MGRFTILGLEWLGSSGFWEVEKDNTLRIYEGSANGAYTIGSGPRSIFDNL
jgi:hypothetical protein